MASNFRFTGAPKIAKYNPKGLDFFLAAPKLKAEVKGAALMANERSRTSLVGLHSSDLAGAQAMTSALNQSREDMMDRLLSNEPVSDADVTKVVKNFSQKKEVDQKLAKGLQNAQRIEQRNQQIDQMILKGGDPFYFNKIKQNDQSEWGGSWNPDGSVNDFVPTVGPKYVNFEDAFRDRMEQASKNLTVAERANASMSDVEMIQQVTAAGTQLAYKQKANFDIYNNHPALRTAAEDFFKEVNDKTTELGAFAEFMGPDYAANQQKLLDGMEIDYQREDPRAPSETLKMGKFIPTDTSGAKYVNSRPKATMSPEIKFEARNKVATPTLNDMGPSKDYKGYNAQVTDMYVNIGNLQKPTVEQLQAVMGTSTAEGAALINQEDLGPIGPWIAGIKVPGSSGAGYLSNYNRLQKNLVELSKLQGGQSSVLFGNEVDINEDGTGEILNQEVFDLKTAINQDFAALQQGWVAKTNKNEMKFYTNPLTRINTETGKEVPDHKRYFNELTNTIGQRLITKVRVKNDGSYEYVNTSAYGNAEDRNDLQREFLIKLNNFGDSPNTKGEGGGFLQKPMQTSYDGRDVFGEDLYSGGKLPNGQGVDGELNDALTFEDIDSRGDKYHYIVGNQGLVSTPINSTSVQYSVGDNTKPEENQLPISTLMSGMPRGSTVNVASPRGAVRVERTDIGWTVWGANGKRSLYGDHFAVSEALYLEQAK
ncbi:MAG: hypothetical protein DRP42_06805 [Tenericutes bacterium]|nr:MAG: hypothetical protein DRP42_06805 [Mycoplasmatota bacterium]